MQKTLIAFALLAAMTTSASAASVSASISLNIRTSPGTNHAIVDTLQPGERVTITRCRGNWCYIRHHGPDGWVAARYLSYSSSPARIYLHDPCDVDPKAAFHLRFGLAHSPLGKYCRERDD